MKTALTFLIVLLTFTVFSACMRRDRYLVESDYSFRADFRKYKSFCMATNMQVDGDSSMSNPIIEKEIRNRLELHGYKMTQKKPSLLVFHKIYYKDFKFQGYNQPDINKDNWIPKEELNEEDGYDPVKYQLREGTLLIQLVDTKRDITVWQGYASGVFDEKSLNNERFLRRAVRSIFDKYGFFADGFLVNERNTNN
jgi:hypothetical protein